MGTKKKATKVAVIGGGCGAMAAVWGLLNSPNADAYEITVYQYGWRLGGKGASGRNAKYGDRIEEHGLHIWGGMYENAFEIMRDVYREADRPAGAPLSVWYDPSSQERSAFWPHNYVTLAEFFGGEWNFWNLELPSNGALPGDGKLLPDPFDYVTMGIEMLIEGICGPDFLAWLQDIWPRHSGVLGVVESIVSAVVGAVEHASAEVAHAVLGGHLEDALRAARDVGAAHAAAQPGVELAQSLVDAVLAPLRSFIQLFYEFVAHALEHHSGLRHAFELADFAVALIGGVLDDHVLTRGFDVVDDVEFTEWLGKHGAHQTTQHGALARGWHDFFFAYAAGDPGRPSLSAASGLRTLFRYVFTYKGAFFWKMQAGMGDTIFAPMWEVFQKRGVRFMFFHRVEEVSHLRADRTASDRIARIKVARQVDLKCGDPGAYAPLVDVKGVPSWPSEPDYGQIDAKQAKKLQRDGVNLESSWTSWEPVDTFWLEDGVDFDEVILAIPPPAARLVTPDLQVADHRFAAMLDGIATNQTLAMQIWLTRSLKELGWHHPPTVGTVFANPHNTWANMDQLLPRETWEEQGISVKSVVYYCGTITDSPSYPPWSDHEFPASQSLRTHAASIAWLQSNFGKQFPKAMTPGAPDPDWSLLVQPDTHRPGSLAFDQQYWRINIDPSERYVLSLPCSAAVRPKAGDSIFANLTYAGDWLYTGINAGCVEAAVMGGLQASRRLSGFPRRIIGDGDGLFSPAPGDKRAWPSAGR